MKLQLFDEAEKDFSRYLIFDFFNPDGYFQRGLARFYLSEKEKAKEDFLIAQIWVTRVQFQFLNDFTNRKRIIILS